MVFNTKGRVPSLHQCGSAAANLQAAGTLESVAAVEVAVKYREFTVT